MLLSRVVRFLKQSPLISPQFHFFDILNMSRSLRGFPIFSPVEGQSVAFKRRLFKGEQTVYSARGAQPPFLPDPSHAPEAPPSLGKEGPRGVPMRRVQGGY